MPSVEYACSGIHFVYYVELHFHVQYRYPANFYVVLISVIKVGSFRCFVLQYVFS